MTQEQKVNAIEDIINNLSDHEMVDINNAYQDCVNGDNYIYSMDDFDDLMNGKTPSEIANMVSYGDYNPFNMWFWFNGYGNVISGDYPEYSNGWDAEAMAQYCVDNDEDLGFDEIREILDDEDEDDEEE